MGAHGGDNIFFFFFGRRVSEPDRPHTLLYLSDQFSLLFSDEHVFVFETRCTLTCSGITRMTIKTIIHRLTWTEPDQARKDNRAVDSNLKQSLKHWHTQVSTHRVLNNKGKDLNVIYEIIWTSFIKQELVVFVSTDRMPGHTCICARRFAPFSSGPRHKHRFASQVQSFFVFSDRHCHGNTGEQDHRKIKRKALRGTESSDGVRRRTGDLR